jgi:hydroxyethylthiazole kinase-like uncharacterized protein yjeF
MENAARAVSDVAVEMLSGKDQPAVLILCGGGNNGGDGLAVARHLHNRGVYVEVATRAGAAGYTGDAKINWDIVEAMGLENPAYDDADIPLQADAVDLIVDALYGTGLSTPPRDPRYVEMMNGWDIPILSVDVPSGLDCDTGQPLGPACVRATRTVTFVAEKVGFANPAARQYLGEVTVGDIGCPRELTEKVWRDHRPA